jgi:hypothetical protein
VTIVGRGAQNRPGSGASELPAHCYTEVGHQPVRERIDLAMKIRFLPQRPGVLYDQVRGYVAYLSHDVEFDQPVQPGALARKGVKLVTVVASCNSALDPRSTISAPPLSMVDPLSDCTKFSNSAGWAFFTAL